MIVKGHVAVTLRTKEGEVIQEVRGPNTAVEMSNYILTDCLYPIVSEAQNWDNGASGTNMTANTTYPTGSNHIGPIGAAASDSSQTFARNMIGYIAIGSNVNDGQGINTYGPQNTLSNQNTADNYLYPHRNLVTMADGNFNINSATYCKSVMSVSRLRQPTGLQIQFSTTFDTVEGNVSGGVAEIGIWTIGANATADGQLVTPPAPPSTATFMRLFAHKVLDTTVLKNSDNVLDVSYRLIFTS